MQINPAANEHSDLNNFFQQAPAAMAFLKGPDLQIVKANVSILELWNKKNEIIGKPVREVLSGFEINDFCDLAEKAYSTGQPFESYGQHVSYYRGGIKHEEYFNFIYSPIKNEKGEITGVGIIGNNVTGQVKAEKEFQESQQLFQSLILEADVAVTVYTGREMKIQLANDAMLKLWGKDSSVIGKALKDALPELEGQPFHALLEEVYRTGQTYKAAEDRADLVVDGQLQTFYFNFSYKPLLDAKGEIYGILNMAVDVTEQVLAKRKAEENERRFQNMVMQAPVAMCVFRGENMVFDIVNHNFFEIIDRGPEVLGKPLLDAVPELEGQAADLLYEVYKTGKPYYGFELPASFNRNGELMTGYYNFAYTPLYEDGKITGVLDVASEITELVLAKRKAQENEATLKAAKNRLNELADSMPQQVWTADADGNLNYVNQKVCSYFGRDCNEIIGQGLQRFIHPDDAARCVVLWKNSMNTGQNYEAEFRLLDHEGRYGSFLGRAIPIKDEKGSVARWIGTHTDITEYKILQRQKDDFLGIASHELKTPVTSIKAYAQVLEAMLRREGDVQKAVLMKRLDGQINKLTSLIGDLLDVTKIQTGKIQFNDEFFDFNLFVEDIIDDLQRTASQHKIIKKFENIGKVFADKDRIGQVITNLITNAVKYSLGADKIVVYTKLENSNIQLCVQDFGIGIPNDKRDKVFEQFYRVSGTKEHTFPGLGLGLYISSEIIKREGGEIWVSTAEGKGSTFCFSLPAGKQLT